ncbi:major facilitator superfamily protein [Hirsutella rhossiliensis]|uniref:Major facilitator superfamily domain-containing protein n=1 Tax=Hirsutella rhossiliensis TaxID=111463 RepID=A0A9P8MSY3_9HYPO|nr:major facilitator superfamily domain-containing protein [Hirsutella rhossiliensis]KAH0960715.1 major facilitator superfamily domain-containing protein [Hirsutella rhossiliensis]
MVAHGLSPGHDGGFMYRPFRLFGRELWYASPKVQLFMVSIVCFLCPGMYNSLTGLGGGGQVDTSVQDHANIALYSTFAVVGFFAGTFANRLGLRLTLSIGGLGYCIYSASFLSYSHTKNTGFVIFSGAFLGLCAALLWTAQGAIMMAYPPENSKGRYISWFWVIFNLGAVIGSLIPLAQNINKRAGPVTDGTYIAFIILMFAGACLSLMLCDAGKVMREDNTKVILMKNPSWSSEFKGLWDTLFQEPWILLLFPMFFASNFFYTYQNNVMNAAHFNTRTRALNNLLYWLAQIFGAVLMGYCLDIHTIRRSVRAKIAFGFLISLTLIIWGGGWHWQKQQAPREVAEAKGYEHVDWTEGGTRFIGPLFLYFFYGFFDAIWQTSIYWFMGSLSNSGRKAANLAGFYKSIQSFGASIAYYMDGSKQPYNTLFGVTWGLLAGSLIFALPVILFKIKDHVSVEDDLKFSDETIEDVVVGVEHGQVGVEYGEKPTSQV